MTALVRAFAAITDGVLRPFHGFPPLVGVAACALVTAMVALVAYRLTSDQDGITRTKSRMLAGVLEIRLFNDSLVGILRAQGSILRYNLDYLRLSLVPVLWMIVPVSLGIAQLQAYYGWSGIDPGDRVLVAAELRADWAGHASMASVDPTTKPPVGLIAPDGVTVETPGVWVPAERRMIWRVAATTPGPYELVVRIGEDRYAKRIVVGDAVGRRASLKSRPSPLDQLLLHPGEEPLPGAGVVESISLGYPDRDIDVFGHGMHWLVPFFVLTLILAFALRKPFGVTI